MLVLSQIPALNASLNGLAAFFLILGFIFIKFKRKKAHKWSMIIGFFFSALFLGFYLYYHYHAGSKKFPDLGFIKALYLLILFPHIILATLMVPLILKTFYHAYKQEWEKHKKVARITFPIWIYVSITGVLIYFMLYVWYA
jgi:uncharacterized membrane protein YozB (DUF420 family)